MNQPDDSLYLSPTSIIDSDHESVIDFARPDDRKRPRKTRSRRR